MEKTVKELEQELREMKNVHMNMAQTYGSELSTGDMLLKEKVLQEEITRARWKLKSWQEPDSQDFIFFE